MTPRGVGHVDPIQPAARRPEAGPPCLVVQDPEGELAVVIVDLLCACDSVKVQRQEVPVVDLGKGQERERLWVWAWALGAGMDHVGSEDQQLC